MPSTHDQFAALVCKTGVGLGLLGPTERAQALLVAAQALPLGAAMTEPEVNTALKGCLAGPAAFLDTDHVELRRWLVDTGYWRRDGFGRLYERVPDAELHADLQAAIGLVAEFTGSVGGMGIVGIVGIVDLTAWINERRADAQNKRALRRAAWMQSGAQSGARSGALSSANTAARAGG